MEKKIRIETYKDDYHDTWEQFLRLSTNGTHFHSMDFLSYHPQDRFDTCHLLFFENGKLLGLMPSAIVSESSGYNTMLAPYGASYGGIVHKENISFSESEAILNALQSFALKNKIQSLRVTFPPPVYYDSPCNYFDFLLLKNNAKIVNREISQVVNTSMDTDEIFNNCSPQCRNRIRKAKKSGIYVQVSGDIESFYKILVENKRKYKAKPTHTLDEIRKIRTINSDWARLFMAYTKDGQPIAGVMTMSCNDRVLLSFYPCHLEDSKKYNPVNLLNYEIACWAHEKGYKWYDLGTSTVSMEIRKTLLDFKEGFGSFGIIRDTYQWPLGMK